MISIEQLLNKSVKELRKMSEKDVRALMDRVRSAGNKRIARAQKSGILSAKTQEKINRGGLLSTKGKNKEELIEEFKRAKSITGGISTTRKKEKEKQVRERKRTREREKKKVEREKKKKTQKEKAKRPQRERTRKKVPEISPKRDVDTIKFHNEITDKYSLDILLKKDKKSLDFVYDDLKKIVDDQIKILQENYEKTPPSVREFLKSKEEEKPTDRNKLLTEIQKMRRFLKDETSTSGGWKTVRERIIEQLNNRGVGLTDKDFDEFFDLYEKLKELSPQIASQEYKYNAMEMIQNNIEKIMKGTASIEDIRKKIYDDIINAEFMEVDTSDFFDIFDDGGSENG